MIMVSIPGSKSIRSVGKLLTHLLLENTCPHRKKIPANTTYGQYTVVNHLGQDIPLLDTHSNFDDDLSNFSKVIESAKKQLQRVFIHT